MGITNTVSVAAWGNQVALTDNKSGRRNILRELGNCSQEPVERSNCRAIIHNLKVI
jgi:hypothetical protein